MRVINMLAAVVAVACAIYVSYSHTVQLFMSFGYRGSTAHAGVIFVELTFIVGGLNAVVSRLRGRKPKASYVLAGLTGLAVVMWSNIASSYSYGIGGIIIGMIIPTFLVINEMCLSDSIIEKQETDKANQDNSPKDEESHQSLTPRGFERIESETIMPVLVEKVEPIEVVVNDRSDKENQPNDAQERRSDEQENEEMNNDSPLEIAKELYDLEGQLPTRKRVMEIAKCSDWKARKALAELKEQIN